MSEVQEALGLYVHIPFCEAKCAYCHFAIDPRRPDDARQERYVRALLTELSLSAGDGSWSADTLYFGGGTPSLLSADRLARLIDAVRARFALAPDAEVTLEVNPRDLDLEGYRRLFAIGVSRLSLGVQSVDDDVLREMGRLHSGADAGAAVRLSRDAGFTNVSVDLILGWPGETRERWMRNLEAVQSMGPDHVSLYVLEIEGKTVLGHKSRTGSLVLPDDDLVADLYDMTVDFLGDLGLERYEISNFARPGFESRHNGKYWNDSPFLGFGQSAHSYSGGRRWWNADTYGRYCRAIEDHGTAVVGERVTTPRERAGEALFTGLRRRHGVDLAAFHARYGVDPLADYGSSLADVLDAGLLEVDEGRLRLTGQGLLLSNEVFRAFV
jgi:oxygen-independent coproporphyrinogen-3 oxidase